MFRQTVGIAMGSPLGTIVANIFVRYYENSPLYNNQIKPYTIVHTREILMMILFTFNPKLMSIISLQS